MLFVLSFVCLFFHVAMSTTNWDVNLKTRSQDMTYSCDTISTLWHIQEWSGIYKASKQIIVQNKIKVNTNEQSWIVSILFKTKEIGRVQGVFLSMAPKPGWWANCGIMDQWEGSNCVMSSCCLILITYNSYFAYRNHYHIWERGHAPLKVAIIKCCLRGRSVTSGHHRLIILLNSSAGLKDL